MAKIRMVKERYSIARVLAAFMLGAVAVAALDAFFVQVPPDPLFDRTPAYTLAGLAGFVAGWHDLGRHLGHGRRHAISMSLGAVFAGVIYFVLTCGFVAMVKVFYYTSFKTVMALLEYWIKHSLDYFVLAGTFQSAFVLIVGGVFVGIISEYIHRYVMRSVVVG